MPAYPPIMNPSHETIVTTTMRESPWHMQTLQAARELDLPDWAIGAGFVRNAVWDRLHGYVEPTPLHDIDVLYFDPADLSPAREIEIEAELSHTLPDRPWSVRNQARMHLRNADRPYRSTADAVSFWLETPTCVAVRLDSEDNITIISPHGLSDLVEMRCASTEAGRARPDQYLERIRSKNWQLTWPKVEVGGLI